MAVKKQNQNPRDSKDLNYYETTGSVSVKKDEANEIIDKSMDAVSQNLLKNNVKP